MLASCSRSAAALLVGTALSTLCATSAGAAPSPDRACAEVVRKITVVGTGEAKAKPDRMHADLGVETEAPTLGAAVDENNDKASRIVAALKSAGIADADLQTQGFTVQDERPPLPGGGQGARVFHVRNILKVTIRDLPHAGRILETAIDAGANETSGVGFGISDAKAVETEAREKAIAAAKLDAETLARGAGVSLGPIQSISETPPPSPGPIPLAGGMSARAAMDGPPVEPGEITSTARVEVVYAIGDATPSPAQ